jgi:ribosomal protein S18 acetylase RimI-like enzyme
MISLEFRKVSDEVDLRHLRSFLIAQPQYYPDFRDWVDGKCIPRVESGESEALIVIQDGVIAGDAVYRRRVDTPGRVELKNFRIDPEYTNRALGHCLLRQVELEGAAMIGASVSGLTVVADVSTPNFSGVEFFLRNGFQITGMEELYLPGQAEYLIEKQPKPYYGYLLA